MLKNLFVFIVFMVCIFKFDCFTCSATEITSSPIVSSVTTTLNTTSKNTLVLGESKMNIVVSNDDMFTSLDTLLTTYTPQLSNDTKKMLSKALVSLVVSVVTGDGSYTLETFKDAFVQICTQYGVEITEDFLDAITKYATYYLDSEFEQNETDAMLSAIYSSLGFISILLVLIWIGGTRI